MNLAAALLAIVLSAPAADHPHVVFILADDMGYGDPRCNNPDSKIATPALDRIAREGMRFTDAHSPGAWCSPSRYGLLTGRYPSRFNGKWRNRAIDAGRPTLASVLAANGYATHMVGKWHLGFEPHEGYAELRGGPVDCGFDSYFGIPSSLDIPPYYYIRGRAAVAPPTEDVAASNTEGWTNIQGAFWRAGKVAPGYRHEDVLPRFIAEAVQVIDAHDDGPMFLYLALPAPHTPWLPPERLRGRSGAGMYGDFVMQVDEGVGRLVDALETRGMLDDTLLFFSSDNGPVWYPHDVDRFGHASVGPLRGMKSDAWEGGHRMPFLVRWPKQVDAGTTSDRLVCFTDVMATLAEIVGDTRPGHGGEDSVSFLATLRGADAPPRGPLVLKANATVLRDGRWKLITHLGSGGFSKPRRVEPGEGDPRGQLYDLEADPGETTNLWTAEPEIVSRLLALLEGATARDP